MESFSLFEEDSIQRKFVLTFAQPYIYQQIILKREKRNSRSGIGKWAGLSTLRCMIMN